MKKTIHVYGAGSLFKVVEEILSDFKIVPLKFDQLNKESFKNNKTILFGDRDLEKKN